MKLLQGLLNSFASFVKVLIVLAVVAYGFSFYSAFLRQSLSKKLLFIVLLESMFFGIYFMGWDTLQFVFDANLMIGSFVLIGMLLSSGIQRFVITPETLQEDVDMETGFYLTGLAVFFSVAILVSYSLLRLYGYDSSYWGKYWDSKFTELATFPLLMAIFGAVFKLGYINMKYEN
jgi:hypothetical protein